MTLKLRFRPDDNGDSRGMPMIGISDIARTGLLAADAQVASSAQNIASVNTPGSAPSRVVTQPARDGGVTYRAGTSDVSLPTYGRDGRASAVSTIDVAQEIVAQLGGAEAFQANVAVLMTGAEVQQQLIDLKI